VTFGSRERGGDLGTGVLSVGGNPTLLRGFLSRQELPEHSVFVAHELHHFG
jgi:hypothetical protein